MKLAHIIFEIGLQLVYQVVYFSVPARSARVKKAVAQRVIKRLRSTTQRHGPLILSVLVNLAIIVLLGSYTINRGIVRDAEMEATIEMSQPGSESGAKSESEANASSTIAIPEIQPTVPTIPDNSMITAITTVAPSLIAFTMPPTHVEIPKFPKNGQGTVSGTGAGSGIGSGSGTGSGTGNGSGSGTGTGTGIGSGNNPDYKFPVILIYTTYDSIAWSDSNLKEARNMSQTRFDSVLADINKTFNVVATATTLNNNISSNANAAGEELPGSNHLNNVTTNAKLVYDLAQQYPEAVAVIFCGGWEDTTNDPASFELGAVLGNKLVEMKKKFYMLTLSTWSGNSSRNAFLPTGKVTGGGFKHNSEEIKYDLQRN